MIAIKKIIVFLITITAFAACVKEDYFGKSAWKQIRFFQLVGQTGNARIVEDSLKIYVTVAAGTIIKSLGIDSLELSTFATLSPDKNLPQDYTLPKKYTVTAEDGSKAEYTILVTVEGSTPQLINAGFDDWYTPAGKNYPEPGLDANSIWASANAGVVTTGANNYNTRPLLLSGIDYAAELVTKDLGSVAQIAGQRMGSATLFTGKFVLNIANPPVSAQFGIAYTARPVGFSVDMKYVAGTPYKNGNNQVLSKTDSADIYVILENRDNANAIKRIATGWYRTPTTSGTDFKIISQQLVYGQLPAVTPDYQKPPNNLYGNSTDKVTHISVVFASSANGIYYEGGVNSTLTVNNFRLLY